MTKSLLFALGLAFAATQVASLHAGPTSQDRLGLGLEVDGAAATTNIPNNIDLTGKYWFTGINALDFNLGGGNGEISGGADYLWHFYKAFKRNYLPLYVGAGGYLNVGGYLGAGARGKVGVDWLIPKTPWEVYGEVVPSLNIIGGIGFGAGVGVGGRYYF